jgi:sarcosine oxidase
VAERVDVAVVGAGAMGLAAAWALRRAGRDPLVLEQFRVGHDRGSSHGATRIFRLAYEEPDWVQLALEALELWRRLERECGEPLLEFTGLLDLPLDTAPLVATLERFGIGYELLDAAEVEQRFGVRPSCPRVVLQPDAGVARADRALRALAAGSRIREQTRVRAIVPGGGGVRLETDGGEIDAEVVVVAAGGWARPLLGAAGIDLDVTPTRETATYFRLSDDRVAPSLIDYSHRETYALTAGPGLLKVGIHRSGPPVDADEDGRAATDPEIVRAAAEWAAATFELAEPDPLSAETCLYTNTPDAGFVLERHGPIVVCSACSGHGFKFTPAVGEHVAALAG